MNLFRIHILFSMLALLVSCHNSSKSDWNEDDYHNDEYTSLDKNDKEFSKKQETQLVTCPMCNGTGVFDFMTGDVMAPKQTCIGCYGEGVCDVNTARQIIQAKTQVASMMGENEASVSGSNGAKRDIYQIEYELNKAYELLDNMEEAYSNSDGIVVRAQYPRMIEEQKEHIRQLEEVLRRAQ